MKLHPQHGRPCRTWSGLIAGTVLLLLAQLTVGGTATGAQASGTPVIHNVAMDTVARMHLLTRVKQVVDWAQADGLYVDLNVHHAYHVTRTGTTVTGTTS